jgi:hypothetical protein
LLNRSVRFPREWLLMRPREVVLDLGYIVHWKMVILLEMLDVGVNNVIISWGCLDGIVDDMVKPFRHMSCSNAGKRKGNEACRFGYHNSKWSFVNSIYIYIYCCLIVMLYKICSSYLS